MACACPSDAWESVRGVLLTDCLLGQLALLVVVRLDGQHDVHEGEDAEDQRLDEVEHELKSEQRDGQDGHVRAVMTPSATSPP